MASDESKIPAGTNLVGKYRVVREIGRGGMAAVYEAEQLSIGKHIAVKVLASELSASTIVIERFFREARAAASVKSPHIVEVYDSGRLDDGRPFIAMELLEGESLYDRMARVRIIDIETTIRVIVHTAKGLVKAHAAGIVHRDLKPENIFLVKHNDDGEEICKILDFGLAKFYAPVNPEGEKTKRLTREGAVFGTPAYMSPEQVKGQGNVDQRADLWALGCMAYECLIGRPVWNMDQGVAMTFAAIAAGPIPLPSAVRPDLPPAFDEWFKKCLERDPNRRYQTAKELSTAFVEAWGQRPNSKDSMPGPTAPHSSPGQTHSPFPEEELSVDVLESIRPPGPPPPHNTPHGLAAAPHAMGSQPGPSFGAPRDGSFASDGSLALNLVHRPSTDTAATTDRAVPSERPKASPVRVALSALFLIASATAAVFVWVRFLSPQVFTPLVQSSAIVPTADSSGSAPLGSPPAPEEPRWAPSIAEGQRLFTAGDVAGAHRKFKDAIEAGGVLIGKSLTEQTKIAAMGSGPCKTVAVSRPRLALTGPAGRPTVAATAKGAIVAWTDDHERAGKDHAYSVMIDQTGKPTTALRDLTPEGADISRPSLVAHGADRTVLLYWDAKGREAGVRVRAIDAEGRIGGGSVLVGAARPGQFFPAIERAPQGFFVVWQDDRSKDGAHDLFFRRLSSDLDTVGPETRLTDYVAAKPKQSPPKVRVPSVAVAANTLIVAYRVEREKESLIYRMRVPLDAPELKKGLDEVKDAKKDREIGDVKLVNEDKSPGDAPSIACGAEGCFIAWHGERSGSHVALIDPLQGKVIWRKRFAERGGHPVLTANEGQVAAAYYEQGRVRIAFLSRDGVSAPSILAKISGDHPRPWLASGLQKGEWWVAWEDTESSTTTPHEPYVARVLCR
jgi:eukaryotic-like serine/threonine-protein kinase